MSTESEIRITVALDENKVPDTMTWYASEDGDAGEITAALISLWDPADQNTLKIDLWTKEMKLDDMKQFFHQTLLTMADTFDRATGEAQMAQDIRDFTQYFGTKMGLIEPNGQDGAG